MDYWFEVSIVYNVLLTIIILGYIYGKRFEIKKFFIGEIKETTYGSEWKP